MKLVTVTRKGQVTIPEEVRKKLGIRIGSKLLVESVDKDVVLMKKIEIAKSLEDLQKYCRKLAREIKYTPEKLWKDIERIRKQRWKERYAKDYA